MIVDVTDARVPASTEAGTPLRARLRSPVVLLNLAGVVIVGASIVPSRVTTSTGVLVALGAVALVSWATWAIAGPGRLRDVTLVIGGLTAAIGAGTASGSLIAPVIAGLVVAISDPAHSPRALAWCGAAGAAALTIGSVAHGDSLEQLCSLLAGFAFGVLGGITRRQRQLADRQLRRLHEASLAAERETARASLLEARSAAARDVHDVLAHSLGGLVVQLDAIEALLERGRVDEAATRASAARRLAGEGLEEARRAVATLRDPDAHAAAPVPDDALIELVRAHAALGGRIRADGDLTLTGLDAAHRAAITATVREALVNARRHAPAAAVHVRAAREPQALVLRVANALPAVVPPSVGGGQGLAGMRERFAALGDESTVTAGPVGGDFVVDLRSAS
jgi:signal transduction histidine kinase